MTDILDILQLPSVQVLNLKPGDVVVLRFEQRLHQSQREWIYRAWKDVWDGTPPKCMILEAGADMHVLRQEVEIVDVEIGDGQAPGNSYQ